MTKPKLCPKTLRWAAQQIRKMRAPDETRWMRLFTNEAYEHVAESLYDWATEAELAEAKRKATALVLEPALTVDQDKVDEHYGRIAYEAYGQHEERARTAVGLGSWPLTPWSRIGQAEQEAWAAVAKAVCVEMAKAVRGGS